MKITVTQDHIDHGIPGTAHCCPVALAVQDLNPDADITIGNVGMYVGPNVYPLPRIATDFINAFDAGGKVAPFEFVV